MADDRKPKEQQGLPEGWERVNLEKDVILITGLRPKGGAVDEGVPSLGGEHISEDGRVIFTEQNARYIPEKFFKLMTKGKAEINDILINKDGANTGKVAILKAKFYPHIVINEHLFILRSKSLFEQKYLFYWLFSSFAQIEIKNRVTGSAQPGLSSSFIKNFFVLRPPLSEQRKIAEILETVDNAIEKTEKIIEKYKRIKQGLMQDLLTKGIDEKGNIRSEKTHKFKNSPLGRIPEEWEVVRLEEVIYFKNGRSPTFSENGSYPIYGSNGLIGFSNIYQFEGNHLIVGRVGASGEVHFVSGKFFASDNCLIGCLLRGKDLNLKYTFLKRFITQTAQPLITQSLINSLKIPLPPLSEQKRIAEILSQIDQTIEKEEKYKEKLERLKKGLMEDLLTGKVRVNKLVEGENHEMA
ncbi:MAG: restriction endonuclease subunit S [Aquificota bacterium]|nr:MAG: restriction endonuclease subunit S [Aquificota bacterium]